MRAPTIHMLTSWRIKAYRITVESHHKGAVMQSFDIFLALAMGAMASQITSLTIVYSTVYSCTDRGGNSPVAGEFPAQMGQ